VKTKPARRAKRRNRISTWAQFRELFIAAERDANAAAA